MAEVQLVGDERGAAALADLLNGNQRRRPVAVITVPAGRTSSWIDAEQVAREVGDLAEVYLMPTGGTTWEFSRRMAEGTQVYGGAGRVYPVGHEWSSDLRKSPLRFAFDAADGRRATEQLISDALRMGMAAGVRQSPTKARLRPASGTVAATVAGRALVEIGNLLPATVAEELVVDGVPIDRLLVTGQQVQGSYDPDTNRLDVSGSLRSAADALAPYAVGDVVLTQVASVRNGKAELVLFPKTSSPAVTVAVLRVDVTTNPLDDLRTLMTVGEVLAARVTATAPGWSLSLLDVDDDEPRREAPALLPGGPGWLVEEESGPESTFEARDSGPAVLEMPSELPALPAIQTQPAPSAPPPAAASRPTPALFDRNRPGPASETGPSLAPPPQPTATTKTLLTKIDGLNAEVRLAQAERDSISTQLLAVADERQQLKYLLDEAERRANRAEHDLKAARARLRKAGTSKSTSGTADSTRFADREQGFRHLVVTRWATRIQPADQSTLPLPDYRIGPQFLTSLDALEGIKREKVADVVVEILTGLAPQIPGREVHRLRTGWGGDDPVRVRDEDGATAWRASLQVNTPSARRIHYWILPTGQVELARVATHDVVTI